MRKLKKWTVLTIILAHLILTSVAAKIVTGQPKPGRVGGANKKVGRSVT